MKHHPRACVIATGSFLPDHIVTNHMLVDKVDTSDEWIKERTGIHQRHFCSSDEATSDLAYKAALDCLGKADIASQDIDLIIVATATPDSAFPSVAARLQARLGCRNAFGFDVSAACAGFVYALHIADNFIRMGTVRRVLVIGAETMSRLVDWSDRTTCVLFGDGAGAFLLQASSADDDPSYGILSTVIHMDGDKGDLLFVDGGTGSTGQSGHLRMQGQEVFKNAVSMLSSVVGEALLKAGLSLNQVDWLIPHQANQRIMQAVARKIGLSDDKIIITIQHHANTSAASIPLAVNTAIGDGRIQAGQLLVLEAIGGGLTWGAVILRI